MKTWGLNMFPVDSKDSKSSFHLADTCLSHLYFTSLYSLYTCERLSIRNVSNLLICWYAHFLNVLTLYVVTEVQSCMRPNLTVGSWKDSHKLKLKLAAQHTFTQDTRYKNKMYTIIRYIILYCFYNILLRYYNIM